MGRPPGSKNAGHDQRRRELARAIIRVITTENGVDSSLRELARGAGVSPPTLRHYFQDRDGAIIAAFEEMLVQGSPYIESSATENIGELAGSLRWFAEQVVMGWGYGFGKSFSAGLSLGLLHEKRGPAFVNTLLEPSLQSLEARLHVHQSRGELRQGDLRHFALSFASPLFLALFHQRNLGGHGCRPLDLQQFLEDHLDGFLRGYGQPTHSA